MRARRGGPRGRRPRGRPAKAYVFIKTRSPLLPSVMPVAMPPRSLAPQRAAEGGGAEGREAGVPVGGDTVANVIGDILKRRREALCGYGSSFGLRQEQRRLIESCQSFFSEPLRYQVTIATILSSHHRHLTAIANPVLRYHKPKNYIKDILLQRHPANNALGIGYCKNVHVC